MEPIEAISLVVLLLCLACFVWLVVRTVRNGETLKALVSDSDNYRIRHLAFALPLNKTAAAASKDYSRQVSDGRFFRDLENGFVDGAAWQRDQIAEYLRFCLAQEELGTDKKIKDYTLGKLYVYKSILRDVEKNMVVITSKEDEK